MNRTKIEWTDYSWNPIVGCSYNCDYCYARQQAKRQLHRCVLCYDFLPHIHYERLFEPRDIKKPSKIFTVSMGEFFDKKIADNERNRILSVIESCPQHTFQILTKQLQNVEPKEYPNNLWLGVSLDGLKKVHPYDILFFIKDDFIKSSVKFLSLEPYLKEINKQIISGFDWVIVGGKTGHKPFVPPKKWIDVVVDECKRCGIPIFLKNNCNYPEVKQEYPKLNLKGGK